MTPDERQLGELIGEVRALGERFAELRQETTRAFEDMKRENAADHAAVVGRLDQLTEKVEGKASSGWVQEIDDQVVDLKQDRDERKGKLIVGGVIFSVIVGPSLVGLFILVATGVIS